MYMLDTPSVGGDTLFANNAEAYNRRSPGFQRRLHGLKAIHSAFEQMESSRTMGGTVRREPVASEHPIVRTHPATGEKALFISPQCKLFPKSRVISLADSVIDTRYIVGFKKEESDALLKSVVHFPAAYFQS